MHEAPPSLEQVGGGAHNLFKVIHTLNHDLTLHDSQSPLRNSREDDEILKSWCPDVHCYTARVFCWYLIPLKTSIGYYVPDFTLHISHISPEKLREDVKYSSLGVLKF